MLYKNTFVVLDHILYSPSCKSSIFEEKRPFYGQKSIKWTGWTVGTRCFSDHHSAVSLVSSNLFEEAK